ncbi:MAG: CCA tRNA nucleotidyltransferase [Dehalococcoidia bacterium]|nr:MAG: CCA tRNA nucleotidyltransferase [Dehalococcoidia bacterium]
MENINLGLKIKERLPARALPIIEKAVRLAGVRREKLFLVGGAARDMLLEKPVSDIDLVLEGNALTLANELAQGEDVKVTLHKPFLTASLQYPDLSLDLTTARRESYIRPGVLPDVQPGNLKDDLFRRDFSINAMAISLNSEDYGRLIDFYGGLGDLHNKLVRILHEKSFRDDATRIWRAVRYEQRLDFRIEEGTQALLRRDLPMLKTISGDRIWYELECVFGEELPEKVMARAGELEVLAYLDPALKVDGWLEAWFDEARRISLPQKPSATLYMALLTFNLDSEAIERLIEYLKLDKTISRTLRDSQKIKALHEELSEEPLQPSTIYLHLHGYSEEAIKTNLIASEPAEVRRNIQLYLDELRYVNTSLNGDDLIALGIKAGPSIKLLLGLLLDARLDGEVKTREDEERLIRTEIISK